MTKFKIPKGYKIVTSCIIFDPNGVLCFNELTAKKCCHYFANNNFIPIFVE